MVLQSFQGMQIECEREPGGDVLDQGLTIEQRAN